MLRLFRRLRRPALTGNSIEDSAALAGHLFDRGQNCTQAVLQATTGSSNPELLQAAEGFGGGIGDSGCLCGAVTGGVMALGLSGKADQSRQLMEQFKAEFRTTCCRGLSKDHQWLSKAHLANCRRITTWTAACVARLLADQTPDNPQS